jgi:hypothetical protein
MQERRIYERHIVILPTKLETILTPGEKKVFDVETRNISIGGAFIYSKDLSFFQEGRRVIIDFTSPSGSFFKYLADLKSIMECTGSMVRSTSEGVAIQLDRECEIIERRQYSYNQHIPERRSGKNRRSGLDRRLKPRTSK